MIFGFLLAIAFDPWIWTGATAPRWALLALLPLLLLFSEPKHFTLTHLLGLLFIAWSALSLTWTANRWDGTGECIQLVIIGSAFLYGSNVKSLDRIFIGLAIGVTLSSLILVSPQLQTLFKSSIVLVYPHGLFGNRNMLAEIAVLTALGCLVYKKYWFIPGLLPSIFWYPIPRGALLALLAGIACWLWPRSRAATWVLLGVMSVGAIAALGVDYRMSSVVERIEVWRAILSDITVFGRGLGSLYTLAPYLSSNWDTSIARVDHAHNEFLEILFELGIPGLVLYSSIIILVLRSSLQQCADRNTGIVVVGGLVISCVAFPWHIPANAFVMALVMGHAVRDGTSLRSQYHDGRALLLAWYSRRRTIAAEFHSRSTDSGQTQSI